jgi:uncharacterized protein (DUF1697 family)
MTKYVAFLRGINVGGRIVKMADLKVCLEKGGLKNVKTILQTGNVVFESDQNEAQLKSLIEQTLTKTFSYPAKVQVLSIDNLNKTIKAYPFKAKEGYHSYVIFIENGLEKDLAQEKSGLEGSLEQVAAGQGVVYWQVERGQTLKSTFGKILSKSKYKELNTNRNLNTLQKIASATTAQ